LNSSVVFSHFFAPKPSFFLFFPVFFCFFVTFC
jgi:hypothetical protein